MARGKRSKGKRRAQKKHDRVPFVIGPHDNLGASEAEADSKYLQDCFIDTETEDVITDFDDGRILVVGRTGSGKSALFARIKSSNARVFGVEPSEVALQNITNSSILTFLKGLDVSLRPFYKLLWRHVFIVEALRAHFGHRKSRRISEYVSDFIARLGDGETKYNRAFSYLSEWGDDFFVDFDSRLKELTVRIENELTASLGFDSGPMRGTMDWHRVTEALGVEEVRKRTQDIVNKVQLKELGDMINLVGKIFESSQTDVLFLVDRLDEDWVEEGVRLELIRALIETGHDFRRSRRVKVVIALRDDLMEQVLSTRSVAGFQPEKLNSSCLRMHWNNRQLVELMLVRYEKFAKEHDPHGYETSKARLVASNMMGEHGKNSVEYMVERTLKRPRDLIAYSNLALHNAIGKSNLAANDFIAVEGEYGRQRLEALGYEWQAQYPALVEFIRALLSRRTETIRPSEFLSEPVLLEMYGIDDTVRQKPPFSLVTNSMRTLTQKNEEVFDAVEALFKVGVLGVKCGPESKFVWSDRQHRYVFPAREYDDISHLRVHKMLRKYLKTSTVDGH